MTLLPSPSGSTSKAIRVPVQGSTSSTKDSRLDVTSQTTRSPGTISATRWTLVCMSAYR